MSSEGQNFGELYGGLLLDELGRQGVPWAEESRQNLDQWVMSISRITVGCASRLLELNQFLAKEYLGDPLPIYHSVDEWRLFYAWCTNRFCHWGVMGVADVKTSIVDVQIHFSLFSLSAAEPFEDRLQEILQRILYNVPFRGFAGQWMRTVLVHPSMQSLAKHSWQEVDLFHNKDVT